jgi:hypothetical protein
MTVIGRDETPWRDPRLRDPDQSKGGDLNRAIENATRGREEIDRLRRQLQGAVGAGDALADAVSDIMADDPESVLHTWVRRWHEAAHPGGR